jgi:hypothetical protein
LGDARDAKVLVELLDGRGLTRFRTARQKVGEIHWLGEGARIRAVWCHRRTAAVMLQCLYVCPEVLSATAVKTRDGNNHEAMEHKDGVAISPVEWSEDPIRTD